MVTKPSRGWAYKVGPVLGSHVTEVMMCVARDCRLVSLRVGSETIRLEDFVFNCLPAALVGIDARVTEGYVVHNQLTGSHVQLQYPLTPQGAVSTGRAFHHGRFVTGLRNAARQEKRQVTV